MNERKDRAQTNLLKDYFIRNGVELVLFDLDDTLLKTHQVFVDQISAYYKHIASCIPDIDMARLIQIFEKANIDVFSISSVNPNRWEHVVYRLKSYFPSNPAPFESGRDILMQIYNVVPELEEGAIETLEVFSETGIPLELVTHANEAWTYFKLDNTGLRKYFREPNVISQDGYKTSEEWRRVISRRKVNPNSVMVIGDNIEGDIISSNKAGVTKLVWVNCKDGWSRFKQGEVPEGTIKIKGVNELVNTLLK
ncbi:MAG TPA: HAD family hydrolase [Patescibacteria group bacterium]